MRFLILCVIASVFLSFLSASVAEAGADSSGGGKSVVCRDQANKILSIELLDLYEARAMFGLEPLPLRGTLDEALTVVKEKFSHTSFDSAFTMAPALERVRRTLRIMPPGTRLEPVDDASPIVLPQGCGLEQTAVWVDRSLVVADHELWNAMDARNQAALIAHEVIYDRTRGEGDKNSRRARKIVGHVFSDFAFTGARENRPAGARTMCISGGPGLSTSQFWIYPDDKGNLVTQIEILHGAWLYARSTSTFRAITWDPNKQEGNVGEWQEIDSAFETGKFFGMEGRLDAAGKRELYAYEFNDKNEQIASKLNCFEQNN